MPADAPAVTAVVLAAGLGRRMRGPNKLLLPWRGMSIIRRVVSEAVASHCERVVVVLGFEADRVRHELDGLPVEFVVNDEFEQGMGTSVRAGAMAVEDSSAVVVCLGDMPQVDASVINALVDAYGQSAGVKACQPVYEGQRGNPVLWGADTLDDLRRLEGDEGARKLLRQLGDTLVLVPVTQQGVLLDTDTPDDLRRLGG
jgi:CTP:molybdopterin cytidylyltransferase MocA